VRQEIAPDYLRRAVGLRGLFLTRLSPPPLPRRGTTYSSGKTTVGVPAIPTFPLSRAPNTGRQLSTRSDSARRRSEVVPVAVPDHPRHARGMSPAAPPSLAPPPRGRAQCWCPRLFRPAREREFRRPGRRSGRGGFSS
jgi:hypothetical protein